ncbi:hypothetical protein HBA55_36445 [Pseudomaricurvus alkylphenolicus]|uniref:hypothetical protein n=1 Tax=Pseudomaricurvus alkylphenolicus TaxID=1306991 RepID=UPI00141F8ED1|nr:hypothetical protein [Pseudomaricurvus alkylphenolicus]NIB45126.1 hypothetical protein [Pseudomaricurvus alkylphenolicus]
MIAEISNSGENRPAETAETGFRGFGGIRLSIATDFSIFRPDDTDKTDKTHLCFQQSKSGENI